MIIKKAAMKATVQPLEAQVPPDRKAVFAEALRRRILSMELAPGAVVDELALCDEFGLSRPPVRELLRQIAAEGYIELRCACRVKSAPGWSRSTASAKVT